MGNKWAVTILVAGALAMGGCGKNINPAAPGSTGSSGASAPSFSFDYFFGGGVMDGPTGLGITGSVVWVANSSGTNNLQLWGVLGNFGKNITSYSTFTVNNPRQITVGPDQYIYAVDMSNHQVAEFSPTGVWEAVFGSAQLGTDIAQGVAVNGNYAYIADLSKAVVFRYTISGSGPTKTFTSPITFSVTGTGTSDPDELALDSKGNVYVANVGLSLVQIYNAAGVFQSAITISSSSFNGPSDIAFDEQGYLYLSGGALPDVEMFSPSGSFISHIGTGIAVSPADIAFDSSGNLFLLDATTYQVVVFKRN